MAFGAGLIHNDMYGRVRKALCSLHNKYLSTDIVLILNEYDNYSFRIKYKDDTFLLIVRPLDSDEAIKHNLIKAISKVASTRVSAGEV
jgi:hypothetical protein